MRADGVNTLAYTHMGRSSVRKLYRSHSRIKHRENIPTEASRYYLMNDKCEEIFDVLGNHKNSNKTTT